MQGDIVKSDRVADVQLGKSMHIVNHLESMI